MGQGVVVIRWSQVEIEGLRAPPVAMAAAGLVWRWSGEALRLGAAPGVLRLGDARAGRPAQDRAARAVRRLIGGAGPPAPAGPVPEAEASGDLAVSDGRRVWTAHFVPASAEVAEVLAFADDAPPAETDLWIVRAPASPGAAAPAGGGTDVICFTPGTMIRTADGERRVETLRPGDRVQTLDDGLQPVVWTGRTRLSGARLRIAPGLRPVRLRAGALGIGRPDRELVVSPGHRMLVRGAAARALFNAAEVLVAAADLVDGRDIAVDHRLCEVTYVHLAFARHQVLWANGLESESFRPDAAALAGLDPAALAALEAALPGVAAGVGGHDIPARRALTSAEAAILRRDCAA